jgi:hypothetical protein
LIPFVSSSAASKIALARFEQIRKLFCTHLPLLYTYPPIPPVSYFKIKEGKNAEFLIRFRQTFPPPATFSREIKWGEKKSRNSLTSPILFLILYRKACKLNREENHFIYMYAVRFNKKITVLKC